MKNSLYYAAINKTTFLACGTLPVMDGALWSGPDKAGIWPVLLSDDGAKSPMVPDGPPIVREMNPTDLSITQPLRDGGMFVMVCGESNVDFTGFDVGGKPLNWACDMVGGPQQTAVVQTVMSNRVVYRLAGVSYELKLSPNEGTCQQLNNGGIRLAGYMDCLRHQRFSSPTKY